MFASGGDDNIAYLYDSKGNLLKKLIGHDYYILCMTFTPDSTKLITAGRDKTIRIWDINTGTLIGEPLKGNESYIKSIAISPDGKLLISTNEEYKIKFWDMETAK